MRHVGAVNVIGAAAAQYRVQRGVSEMLKQTVQLQEVDEVRVTTVVDNVIDVLMTSTEVAKRLEIRPDSFDKPWPTAEHGFAALIATRRGDRVG